MSNPLVSDELWALVAPLLPPEPPKPKGGRPRVPDRACLDRHRFRAQIGHPLGDAAPGVGLRLGDDLLAPTARLAGRRGVGQPAPGAARPAGRGRPLDWSRASLDRPACRQKGAHSPGRIRRIGANRARSAMLWSTAPVYPAGHAPDRCQPPRLGGLRGAARRHPADQDPRVAERRKRPAKVHADKAYDSPAAGRRSPGATSGCVSPARGSTPASGSAATAG